MQSNYILKIVSAYMNIVKKNDVNIKIQEVGINTVLIWTLPSIWKPREILRTNTGRFLRNMAFGGANHPQPINTYVYIHKYIYVCEYTCRYWKRIHIYKYICTFQTADSLYIHIYTHIYTYVQIYIHTHVYVWLCVRVQKPHCEHA